MRQASEAGSKKSSVFGLPLLDPSQQQLRANSSSEVLALKQESRILGQWSNPCMWFKGESSQFSMGQTAQSLTCSIMEKPHTGLDECPKILLLCFRARTSVQRSQ